uniref:Putative lipocalin lipocalin n=1 Tax=Rhipicephalus microplus TaxID=6941 RepID=A0A6G5A5H9_RHIMP
MAICDESTTTEWQYIYEDYAFDKFLSTNESIWTTNTTTRHRRRCQFDLVENVTNYNVTFKRSDFESRRWKSKNYIGNFSNFHPSENARMSPPYDTMDVTTTSGHYVDTEVVHYLSKNDSCAVFFIMSIYGGGLKLWYEMRIKDSEIKRSLSSENECLKELEKVAKEKEQRVRTVYYAACQIVLSRKSSTRTTP